MPIRIIQKDAFLIDKMAPSFERQRASSRAKTRTAVGQRPACCNLDGGRGFVSDGCGQRGAVVHQQLPSVEDDGVRARVEGGGEPQHPSSVQLHPSLKLEFCPALHDVAVRIGKHQLLRQGQ